MDCRPDRSRWTIGLPTPIELARTVRLRSSICRSRVTIWFGLYLCLALTGFSPRGRYMSLASHVTKGVGHVMGIPLNDLSLDKFASKHCGKVVHSKDCRIEQATEQGTI